MGNNNDKKMKIFVHVRTRELGLRNFRFVFLGLTRSQMKAGKCGFKNPSMKGNRIF